MFFLAVLTILVYQASATCPLGFTLTNDYCWMIDTEYKIHSYAEQACRDRNATLAAHDDFGIDAAIISNASSYNFESLYLGFVCYSSKNCVAESGLAANMSKFFYGGLAMPSIGRCVMLVTVGLLAGKWISVDCNEKMGFVCGIPAPSCGQSTVSRVSTSAIKANCGAPQLLQPPMTITSMNYPSKYGSNENCAYFFSEGPFLFTFDYFETQEHHDELVFHGKGPNYIFSGKLETPFSLVINDTETSLVFITDHQVEHEGFSATVTKLP